MNIYIRIVLILYIGLGLSQNILHAQQLKLVSSGRQSSFRGLSVVDENVIWVSGTNGTVGRSINGGQTWRFIPITGFEKFDFRDIEAFDSMNAIIMASSTPAYILKTTDGGKTWKPTYHNERKEVFFDGMDFWDERHGIAFSDAIDGHLLLIETHNGGDTWMPLPPFMCPVVIDSEAAFAASGTTIRCLKGGTIMIATGGKQSRLFISHDYCKTWSIYTCPILQGKPSTGIFSIAFLNKGKGIIVGGDYLADSLSEKNCYVTNDGGLHWTTSANPPIGYKSGVEYIDAKTILATGTRGTDISTDAGKNFKSLSSDGYNVVRRSKYGNAYYLAGGKGRIAKLEMPKKVNPAFDGKIAPVKKKAGNKTIKN